MSTPLPQTFDKFNSKDYWDDFFVKRKKKSFEWYGNYRELNSFFNKYMNPESLVLNVGCGNSQLSADMYDDGIKEITNIDFSEIVIDEMRQKNGRRKKMKYLVMDVLDLQFETETFDVVIDKGGLDAIFSEDTEEIAAKVDIMLSEIGRVTKVNGYYITITLAQEFIIRKILTQFQDWGIKIFRVVLPNVSSQLNPFFVVLEKLQEGQTGTITLDWMENMSDLDIDQTVSYIQDIQVENRLKKDIKESHQNLVVELCPEGETEAKYFLYVINLEKEKGRKFNGKCAVFIVPQGREHEWMFSDKEGQKELAEGVSYQRLIIVHMSRHYTYENIQAVQDELSPKVITLAIDPNDKIPYLTTNDGLGDRLIISSHVSPLSGSVDVEDIQNGEQLYRRMIFESNPHLIQSEIMLTESGEPILDNISFEHQITMFTSLLLFKDVISLRGTSTTPLSFSVIGLGAGTFPMFLHKKLPNVLIESIELDPAVLSVAQEYFGLIEDDRHSVVLGDGIEYIKELGEDKKDVIIIDVDSKDVTTGMSAPPAAFMEDEFLTTLKNSVKEDGLVLINLTCRSKILFEEKLEQLKKIFPTIIALPVADDSVNKIIACFPVNTDLPLKPTALNLVKNLYKRSEIPFDVFDHVKEWNLPDNSQSTGTKSGTKATRGGNKKATRGGKRGKRGKR